MNDAPGLDASSATTLQIGFDGREPPTGRVFMGEGEGVPFQGWLELMHAISGLIGAQSASKQGEDEEDVP